MKYTVKLLSCDPAKLKGLSEKLIISHYENNDHTHALAGGTPILALDMYEHAYAMDYGAGAGAYIDTFMQNIRWEHVARLYTAAAR